MRAAWDFSLRLMPCEAANSASGSVYLKTDMNLASLWAFSAAATMGPSR